MSYVFLYPPCKIPGGDDPIGLPLQWLYQRITSEQICGYSLNHGAVFFDTITEAKKYGVEKANGNGAIFKLLIKSGQVESVSHYQIYSIGCSMKTPGSWSEPKLIKNSWWATTHHAITELNKQYQEAQKRKKISHKLKSRL